MNLQAAMHLVPVKLGMTVQCVIYFALIASTLTITRSVVQNNLERINANLERYHRAGQVGTECVTQPTNDTFKPQSTNYTTGLDYTKLHGFIVSNKEDRYNSSKKVLDKLGIYGHQYVPLSYKSEAIEVALTKFRLGSTKWHTDTYRKVLSNRMAFTDLLQTFANDKHADINSWRFFFEDDIQLHPSLRESIAPDVLAKGMEVAASDGFMYLGICGTRACQDKTTLLQHIESSRCWGPCTHAFALTRWKAGAFLSYVDKLNVSSLYFDQVLSAYGTKVHKIWVLGSNLRSPEVKNHYGLVYQSRAKFPSIILSDREPKPKH